MIFFSVLSYQWLFDYRKGYKHCAGSPCVFYVQFVVKFILLFLCTSTFRSMKKEQKNDNKLKMKDARWVGGATKNHLFWTVSLNFFKTIFSLFSRFLIWLFNIFWGFGAKNVSFQKTLHLKNLLFEVLKSPKGLAG